MFKLQQSALILFITYTFIFSVFFTINSINNNPSKVGLDLKYSNVKETLPKNTKYILLWTPADYSPFDDFGHGPKAFIDGNCPTANCYVTSDRDFFDSDLTKFHAIAFNWRNMQDYVDLPEQRSSNQIYIFFMLESSDNYLVCDEAYDDFFNWTVTYKLDSDIPWSYFHVLNSEREVVAPKKEVKWIENITGPSNIDEKLLASLRKKTKLAAWFTSNCFTRSKRHKYVERLQNALKYYGANVDVYGDCSVLKCSRDNEEFCDEMLEETYFFYLAFENSIADDYITEKVLKALQHNVIPVVFGGASYSRFLPPGSYLDAREHTPEDLSHLMYILSQSPELYCQYFKWKNHYTFVSPTRSHVCSVCAALNNKSMVDNKKVHKDLRAWWNPEYEQRCVYFTFLGKLLKIFYDV